MLATETKAPKRGTIKDMSQKSRARMPLVFATIDYTKMFDQGELAGMVTLTYPQEWHRLVPDATTFKKHVSLFRTRYLGTWGQGKNAIAGIWKMEFQRRGAPHLHIGTTIPQGLRTAPLSADDRQHLLECPNPSDCFRGAHTGKFGFTDWVARVWPWIIFKDHDDAPTPWSIDGWEIERRKSERAGTGVDLDEGGRYSDPKRIGIYFAKHGLFSEKEYQNTVPALWKEKPGARFWGYWVVRPVIVSKEILESLIMHIVRHLRALADRASYSRKETLIKGGHNPRTGEIWEARPRKRSVNRRVKRWRNRNGYGYMLLNNGPDVVPGIARIVAHFGGAFIVDDRESFLEDDTAAGADSWDVAMNDLVGFSADDIRRRNGDDSPPVESPPLG